MHDHQLLYLNPAAAASMNNWLGFSLSSQQQQLPSHGFSSDEISAATADCFDNITSHDSSLQLQAPPFAVLQPFNCRNATDWDMKDVSISSYPCNQETPKLENFLGHSFEGATDQQLQSSCSNPSYPHDNTSYTNFYQQRSSDHHTNNSSTTMGLSMIKNWLRNNPQPPAADTKISTETVAPLVPPGAQTLSLSMSTGSSDGAKLQQCGTTPAADSSQSSGGAIESATTRKSIDTFGQRTSIYRGVTRHRWTGRYEAHLWDNSCRREGQTRKGRQVYLGGYDKEEKAARAYDLAALKYWGTTTTTNFPISNYEKEMEEMKHMTRQEYVASLRRKSSGFSRGASMYRGVTRHHQHGRWQARIGRVAGNKDLYLGTFSTQEEAAEAYDIAAIKFRGLNAVTNFEISRYDVKSILESATLPIGGAAKRLKDAEHTEAMALEMHGNVNHGNLNLQLTDHQQHFNGYSSGWPSIAFQQPHNISNMYPYMHQRFWCKQEQDPEVGNGFNDMQMGAANTQNFMQPSVLHGLMSLDSANSVVYDNNGSGFGVPVMSTVVVDDGNNHQQIVANDHDEGMFGSGENYQQHQRNVYYHHQQNAGKISGGYNDHHQNGWIPTGVPTLGSRSGNAMAVCHGASTFTVWNDT